MPCTAASAVSSKSRAWRFEGSRSAGSGQQSAGRGSQDRLSQFLNEVTLKEEKEWGAGGRGHGRQTWAHRPPGSEKAPSGLV